MAISLLFNRYCIVSFKFPPRRPSPQAPNRFLVQSSARFGLQNGFWCNPWHVLGFKTVFGAILGTFRAPKRFLVQSSARFGLQNGFWCNPRRVLRYPCRGATAYTPQTSRQGRVPDIFIRPYGGASHGGECRVRPYTRVPGRLPSLGRGRRGPQAPRPVPPTRQRPPGRPFHRCRYSFSFPSYPLCCSQGHPAGIDCLQFAFHTADAAFDLLEASTVGRIVTYLCQYGYTYHEGLIDPPYGQFDGVLIDQQRRQPSLDGRSRDRYLSAERGGSCGFSLFTAAAPLCRLTCFAAPLFLP